MDDGTAACTGTCKEKPSADTLSSIARDGVRNCIDGQPTSALHAGAGLLAGSMAAATPQMLRSVPCARLLPSYWAWLTPTPPGMPACLLRRSCCRQHDAVPLVGKPKVFCLPGGRHAAHVGSHLVHNHDDQGVHSVTGTWHAALHRWVLSTAMHTCACL